MVDGDLDKVFDYVAKRNVWGDKDSKSGPGSNLFQTRIIREEIPKLIHNYKVNTILDAPCGDFFWMKEIIDEITKTNCTYTGADIAQAIITSNNYNYANDKVKFLKLNLVGDSIPQVDLILTRDCFLHLSFMNIYKIISNYKKSKSKYLLASTYTNTDRVNTDVRGFYINGRLLNMQKPPFSFPKPLLIINEGCTEDNGTAADKSLALWEIDKIRFMNPTFYLKYMKARRFAGRVKNKALKILGVK